MLQFALLLLGCALSRYLWQIDTTIACVVLGVTALGVIFYTFFVVVGTVSESCPYQTPCARILRHIFPPIIGMFHSAYGNSVCFRLFPGDRRGGLWDWIGKLAVIPCLPLLLAFDTYQLTRAIFTALVTLARRAYSWIRSARSVRARGLDRRMAMLDLRCIAWILRTSSDKDIHLPTLKFLATTSTLVDFNPALVSDCFDILISSIEVNRRNLAILQGMEQLAEASAMCFFRTYSYLSTVHPMSSILVGVRRRYERTFPRDLDFSGLLFPHTLGTIHDAIYSGRSSKTPVGWRDYRPTDHEHAIVAHALSKLSWSEHRRKLGRVPPTCLSFTHQYLSQDPLPPPSVIANCLLIVAINLDCNVPKTMILGERYVHAWRIPVTLLTKSQCTTRGGFWPDNAKTQHRD
jgi:hypothetical protein